MLHILLYFFALFSLSTASNWAKLNHMPVEVLGFYRLGFAAFLLVIWILLKKQIQKFKSYKLKLQNYKSETTEYKTTFSTKEINWGIFWAILSGVFFFLHLWTYKHAAKNTSISNLMILFSTNPIWASIGAIVFFKEKLKKRLILSYLLAATGIYILVAHNLKIDSASQLGNWTSLFSALLYAIYMLTGKKARLVFNNTNYALIQYSICAVLFAFCILESGASLIGYDDISWVSILGLILLPTFFGHFSLTYLVQFMDLSLMTCGKLIEPIFASILAYYIFNEVISPYAWISFLLTTTSILVLFAPSLTKFFLKTS